MCFQGLPSLTVGAFEDIRRFFVGVVLPWVLQGGGGPGGGGGGVPYSDAVAIRHI